MAELLVGRPATPLRSQRSQAAARFGFASSCYFGHRGHLSEPSGGLKSIHILLLLCVTSLAMPPSPDLDDLALPGPSSSTAVASSSKDGDYKYLQEISQMMFVFGHIVHPSKAVLRQVEDIVRHQIVQMIIQARSLSLLRHSRTLSSEDLIFLVRYDRAKVNRLRTYLSWKDVRKNAKEDGGGGVDDKDLAAAATEEDADMAKAQGGMSRKLKVKLPWEIATIFSDYIVPGAGNAASLQSSSEATPDLPPEMEAAAAKVQQPTLDEELDEDEQDAMRESLLRLKEADQATLRMTREEYEHYSECRAASFTFRKGKKFRDFLSSTTYLDAKPNDDIIDILGFLGYEVVREITLGAKAVWRHERDLERRNRPVIQQSETVNGSGAAEKKRKRRGTTDQDARSRSNDSRSPQKANTAASTADDDSSESIRIEATTSPRKTRASAKLQPEPPKRPAPSPSKKRKHVSESPSPTKKQQKGAVQDSEPVEASKTKALDEKADKSSSSTSDAPDLSEIYPEYDVTFDREEHLPSDPFQMCGLFGQRVTASNTEPEAASVDDGLNKKSNGEVKPSENASKKSTRAASPEDTTTDAADGTSGSQAQDKSNGETSNQVEADTTTVSKLAAAEDAETPSERRKREEEEEEAILQPHHIRESFARLQREKTKPALNSGSRSGMTGPMGGLRRTKVWVI